MEEVVDVVDKDGDKVGVATRREVHASGAWHRGVHILVFDSRGRLLLQRRSSKKETAAGLLDLSVSEHARQRETFEQAARRGLREELGIDGLPMKRVLKFRMAYGPTDNMVSVLFFAKFDGRSRLDPSEVSEVVPTSSTQVRRMVKDGRGMAVWAVNILRWYLGLASQVEEIA